MITMEREKAIALQSASAREVFFGRQQCMVETLNWDKTGKRS